MTEFFFHPQLNLEFTFTAKDDLTPQLTGMDVPQGLQEYPSVKEFIFIFTLPSGGLTDEWNAS